MKKMEDRSLETEALYLIIEKSKTKNVENIKIDLEHLDHECLVLGTIN